MTINGTNSAPIGQRATLLRHSPHLTRNLCQLRSLLTLISSVICLWNCFQLQAYVVAGSQQVMALDIKQPNHQVQIPRDPFATKRSKISSANTNENFLFQGFDRQVAAERTSSERAIGRDLDNLKYVNYTSEQISNRASQNHPENTTIEPTPVGEASNTTSGELSSRDGASEPIEKRHTNSRRSLNQPQQQQFGLNNLVGPPKLVQWSKEAVNYYEGSTLVLSCSLSYSGGERGGQLKFSWFKHGKLLTMNGPNNALLGRSDQRLSIETLADYSFLRLADLRPSDSGAYTCVVSNSLNQEDRTTTQVIVNVKLKWLMPVGSSEGGDATGVENGTSLIGNGHQFERARAGQSVSFECNAAGGAGNSRGLRVRWFRLISASQSAATTINLHTNQLEHHNNRSSSPHAVEVAFNRQGIDELQIKKSLLQLDTIQTQTDLFNRIELVGNSQGENDFQTREKRQHSSGLLGGQLRWRIETNSGPSSSGSFQQNEIYSRLILERLEPNSSGLYECEVVVGLGQSSSADSPADLSSSGTANQRPSPTAASGDKLRRFFGLFVNGVISGQVRSRWSSSWLSSFSKRDVRAASLRVISSSNKNYAKPL